VDAHSFDKEYQGVRTFIKGIYNTLLEQYPDLDIYFGASDVEQIQRDFPLANPSNIFRYQSGTSFLRFMYDIPSLIRKNEIDFAHFQYIVPFGKKRCKYIVTAHDILFNDFKTDFTATYRLSRNFLFKRGISNADIKTTVSRYSKERLAYYYKIDPADLHVIPNGVKGSFGKNFATRSDAEKYIYKKYKLGNFLLYVSRIEPRKNHLMLLKAYLNLKVYEQGIPLVFIGKESIPVNELKQTISAMTAEQRRHFSWLEQVDQNDLEAFYKSSRVFVYPSKAEGFGIPPLEAAISGVGVICSNATAMAEYDFFEPYIFDPYDQNDFEHKLERIINSPPDIHYLENVAATVLHNYSWKNSAAKLYELIIKQQGQ